MVYLRPRTYNPNEGRFITEDTYKGQVYNLLSVKRYTYVHNNPMSNVDPTGNWCESNDECGHILAHVITRALNSARYQWKYYQRKR
ncbi:hypothetical protein E1B06_19925 [Brevibacillus laterosporus]|uniref:RHS repeat-associated core domain-containing protein n=1 Tax=Brevibacillus laterosporus TaxID=1465 RepID=UPI003CC81967|nr:hypothetical protein [Brevibacillus laterosporus]